jgi:hypothetical protein
VVAADTVTGDDNAYTTHSTRFTRRTSRKERNRRRRLSSSRGQHEKCALAVLPPSVSLLSPRLCPTLAELHLITFSAAPSPPSLSLSPAPTPPTFLPPLPCQVEEEVEAEEGVPPPPVQHRTTLRQPHSQTRMALRTSPWQLLLVRQVVD